MSPDLLQKPCRIKIITYLTQKSSSLICVINATTPLNRVHLIRG